MVPRSSTWHLAGILAQPDEDMPSDLVEALHLIGNFSGDEYFDDLLELAHGASLEVWIAQTPNPRSTLPCPYAGVRRYSKRCLGTYVSNGQGRRPTGAGQNESALQPGDMARGRNPADFPERRSGPQAVQVGISRLPCALASFRPIGILLDARYRHPMVIPVRVM